MGQLIQLADVSSAPRSAGAIRAYHVIIKPGGSICNLDCSYCFYLHKEELLGSENKFRMSDEILEAHIRQYIEGQDQDEVVFTWQGGEPTLLGIEFFEKALVLEQKFKKPNQRIVNDLQTNGALLNDEWCAFLNAANFLVGLSIDGPADLHDAYRIAKDGKPTFAKVYAAAQLLHRYDVPFNSFTVVNRLNAKRPRDVYRFLRDEIQPREMQFIPCVERNNFRSVAPRIWDPESLPLFDSPAAHPGTPDSVVTDWSVDPDDWGYFLCKVWDDWLRHDFGNVLVNLFETAIAQWMGKGAQICVYHEFCGKDMALEHDGSVYACDHYVYPEYKRGNIRQTSSSRMAFSQEQMNFGVAKFGSLPGRCRNCKFLFVCNGECPKNRLIRTPEGEPGLNYLCSGLLRFWNHIHYEAKEIARCTARGEPYKRRRA